MIFVPLSKVALGTISKEKTGNASGIFDFLRNVGGSIGISAANTIARRHLQTPRNDLVRNVTGASWIVRQQLLIWANGFRRMQAIAARQLHCVRFP
jgi:DHA2 family multidrug resistance protein